MKYFYYGVIILILSSFGIISTILFSILKRKREFGARIAVGASKKDITKQYVTYGNVTVALNNILLNIEQGEMVAVMRPSGSGKTTMLNILGCLDKPSEGQLFLKNEEVEQMDEDELSKIRNKNIGFVFQQFALIDDYTVSENVELPVPTFRWTTTEGSYRKGPYRET